eukprot:Rmarinus@m.23761
MITWKASRSGFAPSTRQACLWCPCLPLEGKFRTSALRNRQTRCTLMWCRACGKESCCRAPMWAWLQPRTRTRTRTATAMGCHCRRWTYLGRDCFEKSDVVGRLNSGEQ